MKKHGYKRKFNRKKFPVPEDLDYSGEKLYLLGWCMGFPVRTRS